MQLFKRTNRTVDTNGKVAPDAVKGYYQTTKPERMWLVWLLSILTFVITVIIVLAVFWVGRWAIHQLAKSKPQPNTVTPTVQQPSSNRRQNGATSTNPSSTAGSSNTGAAAVAPPTPAPATNNVQPTPSTPSLVKTGPDSDVW
jgi:cytoskeletal protein RodZ